MYDIVEFCKEYLTLDGEPLNLQENGYLPFINLYRYIAIRALEKTSKPIVLVKSRQIGGSTMASAAEMYFMGSGLFGGNSGNPPIRIIHAFPQLEHAAAYSKTKLNPMISQSKIPDNVEVRKGSRPKSYMESLLDKSSSSNESLHFKQFMGGNHLWIESTGIDANRLRGRTADVIFYDEVQNMPGAAIGNSLKILNTAKYGPPTQGVQIYFGTPLRQDSEYYRMWQRSTQQYYHLGCEKCKQYFPLYTPGSDEWEKIWLYGFIVKCTHCGHEQNKLQAAQRGKWIATKDEDECELIGFHINQLYMPMTSREDIEKEKPGNSLINTERTYRNEVLGEFFQGDSSPITIDEIREKCADYERKFAPSIIATPGLTQQMTVLGIDYGRKSDLEQMANPEKNKQGQSFSTAVVLLTKGPGLLSIEFAMKFKRNDPESKRGIIDQLIRQYNIQLAVGDIGDSADFSYELQSTYGDRYLV
jgi:hypothetical protein